MADLRRMTLRDLRALARRQLGAGAAKLTTREALVRALAGPPGRAKAQTPAPGAKRPPAPPKVAAAKKPAAKKPATTRPAAKAPIVKKTTAPRRAAAAGAPAGKAGAGKRKAAKPAPPAPERRPRRRAPSASSGPARRAGNGEGALDPSGFFVARVRGEGAVRDAPHPLAATRPASGSAGGVAALQDEQLGELPASYGEDTLVLLPRDPTALYVYWDQSDDTLGRVFRGLEGARVQLWLWARAGDGWELCRKVDLALEARSWYVHGLEPGRGYRAELRVVDTAGRERAIGPGSGLVDLPPAGPSPIVEDRFVRLPWDEPLGPPLGPGRRGPDFPEAAREELARRSGWPEGTRPSSARPSSPGGEGEP